ncbi:MAG: family 10 glycosylhydrolase [Deltaproteobacteria bacterium]
MKSDGAVIYFSRLISRAGIILSSLLVAGLLISQAGHAAPYHPTSKTVNYKCLFNHELLIVSYKKQNSPEHIQSFIAKLKDTDVDVITCCPTMWRTNLYPSKVDGGWKKYSSSKPLSKFPAHDYMMRYLQSGGDPVKDTLDAARKYGKDFFISYRMNDHHYVDDPEWPSHNAFWREHPEYWLGNSKESPYTRSDRVRLFNYLLAPVRDYYFSIIEELCTNYDVDGVELDFQRFPKFFPSDRMDEGTKVMTAFVVRIRTMMDKIGKERGKTLKLCVKVPETLAKCKEAGLDVPEWDRRGLIDMINICSFYRHTMELGIEEFKANTKRAKIYGEMNYVTDQSKANKKTRRYTTIEIYRATALNFFYRGVDGLSFFNYDYVPEALRESMTEGLKRITDVEFLKTVPKDYVVYPNFGTFPATNEKAFDVIIPDDTSKVKFERAVMRVETRDNSEDVQIGVWLNGKKISDSAFNATELFPPLEQNDSYPTRQELKFYAVPLSYLIPGKNRIEIKNLDKQDKKKKTILYSMELALYLPRKDAERPGMDKMDKIDKMDKKEKKGKKDKDWK